MAKQDYYETLGVTRTAGKEELKKAYRGLAMQYHPDRNAGDAGAEKRFKEINEAYDVLKDDQKRAAYDRFGHAAFDGAGGGRGNSKGFEFHFGSGFADIFDEMFGEFMGGGRGRGASGRGADLRYNLEISLDDAFHGKHATIRVPSSVMCEECNGSGSEGGAAPENCPTCHGVGRVRAQQGFFTVERTCPTCGGGGRVISNPCKVCSGTGRTRQERALQVTIPSGVEDGTRIRLAGEGEAGLRGAPPGDLYIFLSIQAHRFFRREGADLYCRVPIPMTTAALGGQIEVPTIDGGRTRIAINAGTQPGAQFRMRNKGMSVLRSNQRGDMYVQVQVETPVNLTRRQRELLEQFDESGSADKTHPESSGFFARVREFFGGAEEQG